jgi:hypothetical protein
MMLAPIGTCSIGGTYRLLIWVGPCWYCGSIVGVAAAPQNSANAARATGTVSHRNSPAAAGQAPTSLGHFYGKATSNLAHIVPAGPQHGKVISAFAKSSNPSHTNGHRGHGRALGHGK